MKTINVFKMKPQRMDEGRFMEMGHRLRLDGKMVASDEALALQNDKQVLAYAQPGGKFGGLLFYTDQGHGIAEPTEKPLDSVEAENYAYEFIKSHLPYPETEDRERARLSFQLKAYTTEAITFDGKERRRAPVKTEISSSFALNDIPLVGPRAKVRMIFKEDLQPIFMHVGLWERLEFYEERELVSKRDMLKAIEDKLCERRDEHNGRKSYNRRWPYRVLDVKLAYFATEYRGGPDLLAPYYFVEVEYEDRKAKAREAQGPRQMLTLPAFR